MDDPKVIAFERALAEAILSLQAICEKHQVCPHCFVELVIDRLEFDLEHDRVPHHGEPPAEAPVDHIGPTQGSA